MYASSVPMHMMRSESVCPAARARRNRSSMTAKSICPSSGSSSLQYSRK